MHTINRRHLLKSASIATTGLALSQLVDGSDLAAAETRTRDSLPLQLYRSLSEEQRQKVCLPANHPRRGFISNWWYIHPEHRIPSTFTVEQQELIQAIFDSLHSEPHREAVNNQVLVDQYGKPKNAPSVGFFGSPADPDFEFIYTGHHVTRRCHAHSDQGHGFGGRPIFYGHFPLHPIFTFLYFKNVKFIYFSY